MKGTINFKRPDVSGAKPLVEGRPLINIPSSPFSTRIIEEILKDQDELRGKLTVALPVVEDTSDSDDLRPQWMRT